MSENQSGGGTARPSSEEAAGLRTLRSEIDKVFDDYFRHLAEDAYRLYGVEPPPAIPAPFERPSLAAAGIQMEPRRIVTTSLEDKWLEGDIDRIIARLDAEIPAAKKEMDELLSQLRTTLIRAA